MDPIDKDCLRQLDNHLASTHQSWLFGAGVSVNAKIPLMYPLTARVCARAVEEKNDPAKKALDAVKKELPDDAHIEHILSHLGDLAALSERSKSKAAKVGTLALKLEEIQQIHATILQWIAETIRWGFVEKNRYCSGRNRYAR